ncbi:MAG: FKBP-type peptidyl-prolyl cis-trans isomerase [Candidatus Sulfotelmatobacter sp.]|jgi:FKBP-type peptidyl-prolyl cis-trans isomerase FklB
MQKSLTAIVIQLMATGIMLLGYAPAQSTPAAGSTPPTQPAAGQTAAPKATTAKKAPVTTKSATTLTLKTQKDKSSYALGMKIGGDLRRQSVNTAVDPALVARGLRDALAGTKALLTEDEERAALTQLQTQVRDQQQAKAHVEGGANRKEGEAFLTANKTKEGVTTLPDGLQYKVLKEGSGPKPTANDTVSVNYRGTLINGKEFDSSYKRGEPISFPVGGVIKGWTEALQLMPVGSKWQLFIPSDLAYGDRGAGGDIGPGETLIFEVELLSIGEQKK